MDSLLEKNITYGALDRALLTLGFQQTTYPTHRLYEKEEQGAVVMLPRNIQMDEAARAVHLLTARHTVSGMGIAGEEEFEKLLTDFHETKPHFPKTADGHPSRRGRVAKPRVPVAPPVEAH